MQNVDLLIINAAQLVTCASDGLPKRGPQMRSVGLVEKGAVAVDEGSIIDVGSSAEIASKYSSSNIVDATGKVVCPGLVDCHTHAVWAGSRLAEFEMRIQGKSYMDIMHAGGGIMSTVRATRSASVEELWTLASARLDDMLRLGTTTAEIKTGYGLSNEAETKLYVVIRQLDLTHPMTIVPTYLGAHAKPPEHDTTDDYLASLYFGSMQTIAQEHAVSHFAEQGIPLFVDIFCEQGVFDVAQLKEILGLAKERGLKLKAHVDEFVKLGGVTASVELGATSVDHLDVTPDAELDILARSDTVGVMLPAVNFNLGASHFGNARGLIDKGGILALSTDLNPGSAPTTSLPMVMAIACRYQKLLPSEALNACTINAAFALELGDRVGSIEIGKQADLLMLDTDDYRAMMYGFGSSLVSRVWIKGKTVWNAS